jgi:ribosomal protein S18 acetylase RimI-like enzyme
VFEGITVRDGTTGDLSGITGLMVQRSTRMPNTYLIEDALTDFPSAVAVADSGKTVGYILCGYMSPDLIELRSIMVHADYRASGLGTHLLKHVEESVFEEYKAIMVTSGKVYEVDGEQRSSSTFYERNGYTVVASTGATDLFWKSGS